MSNSKQVTKRGKGAKAGADAKEEKTTIVADTKESKVVTIEQGSKIQEKGSSNALILFGLVVLWYSSAILCVTTSKEIMMIKKLPNMLCTSQFITAAVMCFVMQLFSGSKKTLQSTFAPLVVMVSLSYTFGFIFTNFAISVVSPSFVETIKAAEPLFSVILGYFFFQEGTHFTTYLTLIPICGGVAIACMGNASYSLIGLVASAASNVGFASRSVFSKRLNKLHPGVLDEVSLFGYISQIGVLVLIPLTLFSEKSDVQQVFLEQQAQGTLQTYLRLLAVNGAAYSVYNLASFAVLAKSDLITHAVFNAFRRVVSISFTVMYFRTAISTSNAVGVAIAVAGVLAFGFAKAREGKAATKPADNVIVAEKTSSTTKDKAQ